MHDLAKEHAARAQVNKMIRKMEDMARNVITHTTLIPVAGNKPRTSATEKRMRKLENRGCIHPSLKLPCVPLCNESLNAVAPKEVTGNTVKLTTDSSAILEPTDSAGYSTNIISHCV